VFSRQDANTDSDIDSDDAEGEDNSQVSNLLLQALHAAVPIQVMLMLLLGLASLVPVCEEEFGNCTLPNTWQPTFDNVDDPPPQ
jgi:hypothetical protein